MTDDAQLLHRYAVDRDGAAFAELVLRYVDLVYSAALRQVNGDSHLAEDVAQRVFTDLARKADSTARREVLAGWLYTTTRFAARNLIRANRRRQARETEAHTMQEILGRSDRDPDWHDIRPVLDEAMAGLSASDRESLLLRFFSSQSFAEIGSQLKLSENAARMRVDRALDRLRARLARRGVTSTSVALGTALAHHAVTAAPVALAPSIMATAPAAAAALSTVPFLQLGLAGLIVAAGVAAFVIQDRAAMGLHVELVELQQRAALKSALGPSGSAAALAPAPARQAIAAQNPAETEALGAQLERLALQHAELIRRDAAINTPVEEPKDERQPEAVVTVDPIFPPNLRAASITGKAAVEYIVDTNGNVASVQGGEATLPEFRTAAVEAIKQWKFIPGFTRSRFVNTRLNMEFKFVLDPPPSGTSDLTARKKTTEVPPTDWF